MTSPWTVLIIEDFLPDRELYRRCLLGDPGCVHCLLEAESLSAGLELCRTQPIDAILLDYVLPDGTGLAFLEALATQQHRAMPPVVMITGQGDERVAVQAIKLGAEDYLVKYQLTPERLQLTMRSAIENARLRIQLQHSENRFRVSIENMIDCFGLFSAIRDETGQIIDFRIDYMNAAALESNRMTVADLGRRLCELMPANRDTGLFADYCRVVETGEPLLKENLIYTDVFGTQLLTRAYDIHASKLEDGVVVSWRDVTARKQAEIDRQQQLERERIVNQITLQIRQSLDLEQVLNTAVAEVRQFLAADRTFLYRFNPDFSGEIVVESIGVGVPPALNAQVADTYFMETQAEDYRQSCIQAVEDVYAAGLTDCHVEMLSQFQIRANLVVPILQGDALWGLVVVSQSLRPRQWQAMELELTQQLATQIGIAIQQAELYQQVQNELRDRQHTEGQLRESQRFQEQVAAAAPGLIYLYDLLEDRTVYVNRRVTEMLGYTPEQIEAMGGEVLPRLFHPDDFARVPAHQAEFQTAPEGTVFEFEYRMQHADGEWRWFCTHEVVYRRTAEGTPQQILGVVQEITGRKRLEEMLQRHQERLSLAIEGAGMATWDFDLQTGRVFCSEGHFRIMRYKLDPMGEMTLEMCQSRVHPEDIDHLLQAIDHARLMRSMYNPEHRIFRADNGEMRWIQLYGRFLYNETGEAIRSLGVFFDVTERKQMELDLAQSNDRFELAAAAVTSIIYDWDLQTDRVERTRGLYEVTGYLPEESDPSAQWWFDLVHPDDRTRKSRERVFAELVHRERYNTDTNLNSVQCR
jgi:PAS domain S-box-containing protein